MKVCSKCGESKAAKQFAFTNKATGKRRTSCKKCESEYYKAYSKKNPKVSQVRMAKFRKSGGFKRRRERLKAIVVEMKTGKPCADCGEVYPPCAMDFDHVRGKKKATVSEMTHRNHSEKTLLAEIAKCEVVCAVCHRLRTDARLKKRVRGDN